MSIGPRAFFGEVDPVRRQKRGVEMKRADSMQVETALGRDSLKPLRDCRDEDNSSEVINRQRVVSSCDTLSVFEMTEHPFNDVAASVGCPIERIGDVTRVTA